MSRGAMSTGAGDRLPPDRGGVSTEGRAGRSLDAMAIDTLIATLVADQADAVAAVQAAAVPLAGLAEAVAGRMARGGRLLYAGAGTSGRLGVLDASECPPTFAADPAQVVGLIAGGTPALTRSSERLEDEPGGAVEALAELRAGPLDTLVGLTAGGTTPYVLGAVAWAGQRGIPNALICCSPPPAEVVTDHLILLETGPEAVTGSTRLKAGTATKVALNALSTAVFIRLGKVYGDLMVDLRVTNDKLLDRGIRIVQTLVPDLSRVEAAAVIEAAGGEVKVAVVMARRGWSPVAAREALGAASGNLRAVIGER